MKKDSLITKKDIIIMIIIAFIYAIISFINLGTFKNPQTFWKVENYGQTATFKIKKGITDVSNIRYYLGADFGSFDLYVSYDGETYSKPLEIKSDKVFAWKDYGLSGDFEYIKLVGKSEGTYLGELAIYDKNGEMLELEAINNNAKLILDEQNTVPDEISFMNSTYFDEIYFARTAYEHLHNLPVYEWTHPPLGKLIMAIPMLLFGMTTFAYRLMGNIAGICMIPTIYIFAKMLFKETKYGVLAAIIMAADGMHFVQSRLGTADGFLVLFIMLAYLFMYRYVSSSKDDSLKKKLWSLFFSGLFMGLSIATKWTGCFAAIGLAIIFFVNYLKSIFIDKNKLGKQDIIIVLSCIVFFVIIPIAIYVLSYIPFYILEDPYITDIESFWDWQVQMFDYHHDLVAEHPYSSKWYTWPISKQSVFYWSQNTSDGLASRIALLGNPAIWWFSIPCMVYVVISAIKSRRWELGFIIVPIVAMMASYVGVERIMFLYHYFPVLPFVMLCIVAFMKFLTEKTKTNAFIYVFVAIIVIVFEMFYPVYSGLATTPEYLKSLQWLDTWKW